VSFTVLKRIYFIRNDSFRKKASTICIYHLSSFSGKGNDVRSHQAPYLQRAAPRCDNTPVHKLRLYNGLIALPYFREALSRWGLTFEPRAAPSSEALRSLGTIAAARPHSRRPRCVTFPTCAFRFFSSCLFPRLLAKVIRNVETLLSPSGCLSCCKTLRELLPAGIRARKCGRSFRRVNGKFPERLVGYSLTNCNQCEFHL